MISHLVYTCHGCTYRYS